MSLDDYAGIITFDTMKHLNSKRRKVFLSILILIVLLVFLFWPTSTRSVSVAMTGPSGLVVAGHWTVDGVPSDFRATLPTNFVTSLRSLSFELVRQGDPGIFKIQFTSDDKDLG